MPWQELALDVALELLPDGSLAYRQVIITVERQQGKTTLMLGVEVQRALLWARPRQRIYYSAQTGQDGRQKLIDDQAPILEGSPLMAGVLQIRKGIGSEGIVFRNGSRIDVMASSEHSGHGKVVDLGVIDEAFSDVDDRREQAMTPAMMTKQDAQLWIVSTAGTEGSAYLKRKVDAGRNAVADESGTGTCYLEYSADPSAPIDDPATWWSCMPALGLTISEEVVRNALRTMPEGEFRRAFLNQWTVSEERVIPAALWNAIQQDVQPEGGLVFGVDAMPDRSRGSIVAVDSQKRCELIDHRPGVTWMLERIDELVTKWAAQVVIDSRGPAASLIPELEDRGVPVVKYGSTEMAAATARLFDAIADREPKVRPHPDMDQAVAGARKRIVGDSWYWGRTAAHVDVSPLVALTLAYDLAVSNARTPEPFAIWA